MKKVRSLIVLFICCSFCISCDKNEGFNPQGGQLPPSEYVFLTDSIFSPNNISIVNGSAILFVNQTEFTHTLMSDDSVTLKNAILPNTSYYYKPDTLITSTISIPFHCVEHPNSRGVITIDP